MINVVYKKKGLKIKAVWFCNDIDKTVNMSKSDFIFFHGVDGGVYNNSYKAAIINKQYSLRTDLRMPPEEIFKEFSKNYRYEINRAKKENVECNIYNAIDLKNNLQLLSTFKKEYDEFVKIKGIENTYNELAMEQYIKSGSVLLTKAFKDDVDYAQHVYVYDNKIARLLYSVSNFRTDGLDSNLIGRANKYLHWFDIQYLCKNKVELLDWGGISSIENPNGVDKFKKEFGGCECSYNNIIVGKSILGKLAIILMKLKRS